MGCHSRLPQSCQSPFFCMLIQTLDKNQYYYDTFKWLIFISLLLFCSFLVVLFSCGICMEKKEKSHDNMPDNSVCHFVLKYICLFTIYNGIYFFLSLFSGWMVESKQCNRRQQSKLRITERKAIARWNWHLKPRIYRWKSICL